MSWLFFYAWIVKIFVFGYDDDIHSSIHSITVWSVIVFMMLYLKRGRHWVFKAVYYLSFVALSPPILYLVFAPLIGIYVAIAHQQFDAELWRVVRVWTCVIVGTSIGILAKHMCDVLLLHKHH